MTTTEASDIWHAERRQRLAVNLLRQRPPEFDRPGALHPDLTGWAAALAEGRTRNVIITGPVGVGKTWAVWHAAEYAVRAGYDGSVIITSAGRLRRITAPATADPAEFTRYCECGLLALDDVGSIRVSDWDLDNLAELSDIRWANQRTTIVTSNKTDLAGLLGPRISSRLSHNALVVEMDGPDLRRQP